MYRINLSKFDDFISGNNAGVISRASSIKRNSCVLSGRRPAGGGRAAAKRAVGGGGAKEKCINTMKNPDKGKLDLAITSVRRASGVAGELRCSSGGAHTHARTRTPT